MTVLLHICSWTVGCYRIKSESGKQVVFFEDTDQFGPSFVNMTTGDVRMIPERHWFWKFYGPWRKAGRPTEGAALNTKCGPLEMAKRVSDE